MRPCLADHADLRPVDCKICWLIVGNSALADHWGIGVPTSMRRPNVFAPADAPPAIAAAVSALEAPDPPCRELLAVLSNDEMKARGIDPATCGCQAKLRGCGIHGLCTTATPREDTACCADCPEYDFGQPPPVLQPRHLLYHVYPRAGNGIWQMNLDQLRRRLPLFDGVRAIAIAIDAGCDSARAVQSYLADERVDEWIVENDPKLREMATWDHLWSHVVELPGCTFYAHAKGVTHAVNACETVHRWAEIQYETCLDYWPLVERMLHRWPIVGSFKRTGKHFVGSNADWHYSGTFFWVQNERAKPELALRTWFGNEDWPGQAFASKEGGVIFGQGASGVLDLYQPEVMARIEMEYTAWKLKNAGSLSHIG